MNERSPAQKQLIFMLRHGESASNAGQPTSLEAIDLTEVGKKQAQQAAESLPFQPDLVIASQMRRSTQTAAFIVAAFPAAKYQVSELCHEFTYLTFPPDTRPADRLPRVSAYWKALDVDAHDAGGESFRQFYARAHCFVDFLHSHPSERILVVSHEMFMRAVVEAHRVGASADLKALMARLRTETFDSPIRNCELIALPDRGETVGRSDSSCVAQAIAFSFSHHREQVRPNRSREPKTRHLAEVAKLVENAAESAEHEVAVAWLHDLVEDTPISLDEIEFRFSRRIALMVGELSDPPEWATMDLAVRKAMQRDRISFASAGAKRVKLADQISNIKSVLNDRPLDWDHSKAKTYVRGALDVGRACAGVSAYLDAQWQILEVSASQFLDSGETL